MDDDAPIDARALSKLRWRCRRGLLENDLFIERFFARHAGSLTVGQSAGLMVLMDLGDNDLLDLLLARTEPDASALGPAAVDVLRLMRAPSLSTNLAALAPVAAFSTL
jgi:antitoxin CptB